MRKRSYFAASVAIAATSLAMAGSLPATAAPDDQPDRVSSTRQLAPSSNTADKAIAAAKQAAAITKVDSRQSLKAVAALADDNGTNHVRMERTYQGLPVVGGDLVLHTSKAGKVSSSQTLEQSISISITPKVKAKKARSLLGAKAKRTEKPELVVDALGSSPKLAWKVTASGEQADGTPSRIDHYVDAQSGKVLHKLERIHTVDGEGQSLYGGTVPLELTQSGSSFQLKDPDRGNTYTIDVNNGTDSFLCTLLGMGCATGPVLSSPDNSFGNGATSSRESAAVDAQYGTAVTWDYYSDVHGRAGIFGNGTGSFNRVHYGNNYANAFWDGEKMTYGDGDGGRFGPLVSLDVAGHEMSHGVTENTAGLVYSGESGGLNEATSDIFGTMVEFHAANSNDKADYLIGEMFDSTGEGFRRMDNPSADGDSVNCWSSSVKNLDVHYSSGVGNHFYYLLAEGSGAKTINGVAHNSPTCNNSSVTGIGRADAEKIWYRALTVYMTSNTNYAAARTATLNAARDLYGAGSTQHNTVAAAWSAVSVN